MFIQIQDQLIHVQSIQRVAKLGTDRLVLHTFMVPNCREIIFNYADPSARDFAWSTIIQQLQQSSLLR